MNTDIKVSSDNDEYKCYYISNNGREYFWTGKPSNLRSRFPEAQILCTGVEAVQATQMAREITRVAV